jgi:hypothetical protein
VVGMCALRTTRPALPCTLGSVDCRWRDSPDDDVEHTGRMRNTRLGMYPAVLPLLLVVPFLRFYIWLRDEDPSRSRTTLVATADDWTLQALRRFEQELQHAREHLEDTWRKALDALHEQALHWIAVLGGIVYRLRLDVEPVHERRAGRSRSPTRSDGRGVVTLNCLLRI